VNVDYTRTAAVGVTFAYRVRVMRVDISPLSSVRILSCRGIFSIVSVWLSGCAIAHSTCCFSEKKTEPYRLRRLRRLRTCTHYNKPVGNR
jgi:hypothetical protein